MSIVKGKKPLEGVKSVHFAAISPSLTVIDEKSELSTASDIKQTEVTSNVRGHVEQGSVELPSVEDRRESLKKTSSVKLKKISSQNVAKKQTSYHNATSASELSAAKSAETDLDKSPGKRSNKKRRRSSMVPTNRRRRSSVKPSEKLNKLAKKTEKHDKSPESVKQVRRKSITKQDKPKVIQDMVIATPPSPQKSTSRTPTPVAFETASVSQRKKHRMEDLIQSYTDWSPDGSISPHSPMSPASMAMARFGNVFRAARVWEKGEGAWERKKVRYSSDESNGSSTSVSDSEEDEFALSKIPIKKTNSSLYSPNVVGILHSLEVTKKKRKKKKIRDQVKTIKERVHQALKNVDMHDHSSEDEGAMKLPMIFPTAVKRTEDKRRTDIVEGIVRYVGECNHRYQLISEANDWISDPGSLAEGMIPDEEMDKALAEFEDIHENIIEVVEKFGETTEKVVNLGSQLLKEASNIIKENELQAKKMQGKSSDFSIVYDERGLLADPVKWDNAVKMVTQTLNDASKWTKNANHKYLYGKTSKQFKNLAIAMVKKEQELKEKRKGVEEFKTKLNITKAAAEKQMKETDEIKKVVRRMSVDVEEKKNLLAKFEEKNKGLLRKLAGYESQMKTLETEIETRIVEKTVTVAKEDEAPGGPTKKLKKPPPAPEVVKVIDSSTQLKLDETEVKLKEALDRIEILREKLRELDRMYKMEQERVKILKSDLEKAEKATEDALDSMPDMVNMIELPIEPLQQEVEKDSAYFKTLLSGMKNEFNGEIEKLKGFLKKEKSRNVAAVRRVENNHKDHLHAIQKDTLRVLRAIIHFRDHVVQILEKENLREPAFALTQMQNLIPEKLVPDPRELLALLVGNVVEYMHKMELTLANAFLAMRMVVRGAMEAHKEQQAHLVRIRSTDRMKDEETKARVKHVEAAKMETQHMSRRLRKARERLQKFEEISDLSTSDRKYLALLERYRMVWKMYNRLQKDMDGLQTDFQSSLEEKIKEREDFMVSSIRMDLRESRRNNEQQLKITITDQKKNLDILQKAYEGNKISKELYAMAVSLIRKAMVVPQKRLRFLVEQYIAFQTVHETKQRVKVILSDEHLGLEMRKDIISYMKRIDEKFHMSMTMWHEQMGNLENERRNLFRTIWKVFTEVVTETGLLLVHPLLKEDGENSVYQRLTMGLNRDQLRHMLSKRRTAHGFNQLPSAIKGYNALNSFKVHKMWQTQYNLFTKESAVAVDTPHVVNYDVNKPAINAKRKLMLRNRGTFPVAHGQNYIITKEMNLHE